MTMWDNKAFTENELSRFGKIIVSVALLICVIFSLAQNLINGTIPHPFSFVLCFFGFLLFFAAKTSLFLKGKWLSFGTKNLSENMANFYRIGYWVMAIGLVLTFCE